MTQEKHLFQTEAAELLKMMIHSVYSNKDIFLRELISNASDALDKRRIEVLSSNGEYSSDYRPEIKIVRSKAQNRLAIMDNGIGMSHDEIIRYIGTIAKSGTKEFLAAARKEDSLSTQEMLIGQFGVGFYSAFMVADRVEVVSRRLGSSEAWKFESSGDGSYTLNEAERAECGTTVVLYLREPSDDDKNYADEWVLRDIIKKYSDFIAYPILMNCSKWKDKQETEEEEVVNSQKAIWCRPDAEVTEEEYREFYRHLSHDWQEPLTRIILNAEGSVNFKGLLFIPQQAPFDMFMNPKSGGISLYIKRVFIMNDCKELIPEYLRFVKGIIDSEDLPLNISREILQEDQRVRIIRRSTLRKIFSSLRKMLENEREKYEKYWNAFGKIFKEGAVQDRENANNVLELSLFHSTNEEGWSTLDAYKTRMKEGQEGVYYLVGRDISILKDSPKLEAFREKGYDVLLLTDPVDEVIMNQAPEFGELKFLNVDSDSTLPGTQEEREKAAEKIKNFESAFALLKTKVMEYLGDLISDVRLSSRMKSSPACLIGEKDGMSLQMEQMMRTMGHEIPPHKRVLEMNPEHPVVAKLMDMAKDNDDRIKDFVSVLYDQALILEGGAISDPGDFARRMSDIMQAALRRD